MNVLKLQISLFLVDRYLLRLRSSRDQGLVELALVTYAARLHCRALFVEVTGVGGILLSMFRVAALLKALAHRKFDFGVVLDRGVKLGRLPLKEFDVRLIEGVESLRHVGVARAIGLQKVRILKTYVILNLRTLRFIESAVLSKIGVDLEGASLLGD